MPDAYTLTTAAPTAAPPPPELLMSCDDRMLTALTIASRPLDLGELGLAGAASVPFTAWARVADFRLEALPPNHCLQARSVLETGPVALPAGCRWVRSLLTLQPDKLFWATDDFEVTAGGAALAWCDRDAGQCAVDLPG